MLDDLDVNHFIEIAVKMIVESDKLTSGRYEKPSRKSRFVERRFILEFLVNW